MRKQALERGVGGRESRIKPEVYTNAISRNTCCMINEGRQVTGIFGTYRDRYPNCSGMLFSQQFMGQDYKLEFWKVKEVKEFKE